MANQSTRDKIYSTIKERILRGQYHPGEHLVESVLAEDLETSKTPVREAFGKLEQEGLIEAFPFRGYFVRSFDQQDLDEMYELRELYEGACARACAESQNHRSIAEELVKYNDLASAALDEQRLSSVHEHFAHFDEIVFGQTKNSRLRDQIVSITQLILMGGAITNRIPGRIEQSIDEHKEIITGITAGDGDEAEAAMRRHVRSLRVEQASERFVWPI